MESKYIRNVAIIAHVDHGKTTLVNQLLSSSGTFHENAKIADRVLDSNPIERERGITILAKPTAINFGKYRINILDTPGHADFGGEVERIMHMVDGCLLLVDAFEGTMPQTRFVLKKALEAGVKPIVIINKIDRPNASPEKVIDEVLNLFIELNAPDEFLDFPIIYTSALNGTSSFSSDPLRQKPGMNPIFTTIVEHLPAPKVIINGPLIFQPALLDYNDFVGRIGIGRVESGTIRVNGQVALARLDGSVKNFKVQKLYGFFGLDRLEITQASAGDVIGVAGVEDLIVGETINDLDQIQPLPPLHIDEPTLQMTFGTNSSPLAGLDGSLLTARKLEERLFKEVQRDVSLRYERILNRESWVVSGRGELHLSILIENMRREGYELEVSKPTVITKEIDGVIHEPYEDVQIDVPVEYMGSIMEALGGRGGDLITLDQGSSHARLHYLVPSRGLIGFSTIVLTLTKGYGVMSHTFKEYRQQKAAYLGERSIGVLVSTETGKATPYAIQHIEERGVVFIEPGTQVYEGMIVGENRYDHDLAVNITTTKALTNMRAASKDSTVVLKVPRRLSIEACLDYINGDELVEITPNAYRMRKRILNTAERKKYDSKQKKE
ncbi:MAG: translational GTPase TypA [Bacilli bacterium]|jgi:GTP-binding protein|nr:translational GTPase TypA [Bacilli bacterium]